MTTPGRTVYKPSPIRAQISTNSRVQHNACCSRLPAPFKHHHKPTLTEFTHTHHMTEYHNDLIVVYLALTSDSEFLAEHHNPRRTGQRGECLSNTQISNCCIHAVPGTFNTTSASLCYHLPRCTNSIAEQVMSFVFLPVYEPQVREFRERGAHITRSSGRRFWRLTAGFCCEG